MKYFVVFIVILILVCYTGFSQKINLHTSLFSEPKYALDGSISFKPVEKNMKELREMMKNCNDCKENLENYKSKSTTSEVLGFIGGFSIGWPIGGYIGGGKWQEYYTPMMLGGAGVIIISMIVASSALSSLEEAVELYNRAITQNGIELFPGFTNNITYPVGGKIIGVSISF